MAKSLIGSFKLLPPVVVAASLVLGALPGAAHIIPPENLHPVAEAYRQATFLVNLNPVVWGQVRPNMVKIVEHWASFDAGAAATFKRETDAVINRATRPVGENNGFEPMPRREAASQIFALMTRAIGVLVRHHLESAAANVADRQAVRTELGHAQGVWESWGDTVRAVDPKAYRRLGAAWLGLSTSLGSAGLLEQGAVAMDQDDFRRHMTVILDYLERNFGPDYTASNEPWLAPRPVRSSTYDAQASLPIKLPPGSNINKQVPRPRQILNMSARGVDERDTPLIAIGDMAFDSAFLLGDPSRALSISCNTCHNKSITNPQFMVPGTSSRPGTYDVSNSFFGPHNNNGVFDPVVIPDLRGIRFTAPYGRNGRFASLRDFVRNGIVNEFNGPEPDPVVLDAIIAYMNEFDFLTNDMLNPDGTLNGKASKSARRGEKIFNRPFSRMGGRSCASCHVPSANFLDHKRHDIGTVAGYEAASRDRAMDTPTLLGIKYTPPYFHDGSQPTIRSVVEWFNDTHRLELGRGELDDLTAYVNAVGAGVEAYEDTVYYLDAEMEEFVFFLSAFEFLDERNKVGLIDMTFKTVAMEINNHKWELQDWSAMPIMERLAEIMDEAVVLNNAGQRQKVRDKVREYRKLYAKNVEVLK